MGVEVSVHEGGLDQALAVVEDAIDLEGGDVLAEGGELTLLDGRDLALGVEDIDVDAIDAEEAVGDGGTGVTGGCDEDVEAASPLAVRGSGRVLAYKVLQEAGHEAGADILEGEGGPVEELEGVDIVLDVDHGGVEGEGVADDTAQVLGGDVLAEEGVGDAACYFLEGEVGNLLPEGGGQLLDDFGHIEAPVLGKAADDGVAEGGAGGGVVGAIVE